MGVVTGCGLKEIYRFPHTTYPYSSCICTFLQQHPYFFVHLKKYFSFFIYIYKVSQNVTLINNNYSNILFREKGKVVLLGDFNARVGRSVQIDDVIGMFGEDMRNASGNRLLSFLNEVELMICNGRKLVFEPEWTRIRPSLKQKSIIDYIITDAQLLEVSGNVHVDRMDIGSSDHFLVWMELGRATKSSKKRKRVIRRWRLDRFGDDEVKLSYQNALRAEVS